MWHDYKGFPKRYIGWEQLITKISHNHSIAAKVRTNLVGFSEKEINAFHRAF